MKKIYDVTIPVYDGMIVWPGGREVSIKRSQTIEKDGYNWSQIEAGTHIGTHVDAPVHFIKDGGTLDDFPLDLMIGGVSVVECNDDMVSAAFLEKLSLPDWRAVFFKTKNQRLWKLDKFSEDYVSLTPDAALFLVKKKTELVGIDYRSIETFDTHDYPVHKILLGNGTFIIEGLCLNDVPQGRYNLHCLPLKLRSSDGGPVRVLLEEK